MLQKIKSETERIMRAAMPDFRLFRHRPEAFEASHMPFIHVFFHDDRIIESKGFHDDRRIVYEIEACFAAKSDAELEIMNLLDRIEAVIRLDEMLEKLVTKVELSHVDFGHKKIGEQRIAALLMCWHIEYIRDYPLRPEQGDLANE